MNYEIVQLEEKMVAGLTIKTSNDDPNMGRDIGMLWQRFYAEGIYDAITSKKNPNSMGLYTNYENGVNGSYDVVVCCEIENTAKLPEFVETRVISAGKYAKFIVRGHVQTAVADFWMKLWAMDLDRKYTCDFEDYQSGDDMANAEIHIYIAIN